ncbi:hypothetical protein SGLAD_v1c07820 [Spiroplasma gladiatoris]|uniref:J domain-containing protein n=1 Tax=Spiroplasma gladiatoris TaxID=2143 RepID=A0A4P7AIG9_9MOLU|nr:J domain-containing protein [Spiroplasma gladiatoris]QBQ07981.1 hypothetical protein SGLAD_v1c07820 [Spiroplasma gladiatoris]
MQNNEFLNYNLSFLDNFNWKSSLITFIIVLIGIGVVLLLLTIYINKKKLINKNDHKDKKTTDIDKILILTKENKEEWFKILKKNNRLYLFSYEDFTSHPWYKKSFKEEYNILYNYKEVGDTKKVNEIWELRKALLKDFKYFNDFKIYYNIFSEELEQNENKIYLLLNELKQKKIKNWKETPETKSEEVIEIDRTLDPYSVLGVDSQMSIEEIKEIYYELSSIYKDKENMQAKIKYQQLGWAVDEIEKKLKNK